MEPSVRVLDLVGGLDAMQGQATMIPVPENGQVVGIVVLARIKDGDGDTVLRLAHSPGLDWLDVAGIIREILNLMDRACIKEIVDNRLRAHLGGGDGVDGFLRDLGLGG